MVLCTGLDHYPFPTEKSSLGHLIKAISMGQETLPLNQDKLLEGFGSAIFLLNNWNDFIKFFNLFIIFYLLIIYY